MLIPAVTAALLSAFAAAPGPAPAPAPKAKTDASSKFHVPDPKAPVPPPPAAPDKSVALIHLDGKPGKQDPKTFTDLDCGEAGPQPKIKFDFTDRKDGGPISSVQFTIAREDVEKGLQFLATISRGRTAAQAEPGKEIDTAKLPDGWYVLDVKTLKKSPALEKLPAGKYMLIMMLKAESATGIVRAKFEVK